MQRATSAIIGSLLIMRRAAPLIGHPRSVQPDTWNDARSPLRVLYVDDEADIREIVEIALGLDPSLSLHGCASGAEALKAAAEWHPDLILLDVMMPGMDGPTTLAHLRKNTETADIPVVFMTARARTRELDHFKSLGAAGVITKPFDPMTLSASVRNHSQAARLATLRDAFVLPDQQGRRNASRSTATSLQPSDPD